MGGRSAALAWGRGRAAQPSAPRFRVQYRLAERLVAEVARCLNGGFFTLDVGVEKPVGTRMIFELSAWQLPEAVELEAIILATQRLATGWHRAVVRYWLRRRGGLDAAIYRVLGSRGTEPMRRAPRLPVRLPTVADDGTPTYHVRDLSLFGAGVDVDGFTLPPDLQVGAPVRLTFVLEDGKLLRQAGEVVWLRPFGSEDQPERRGPGFGIEMTEPLDGDGLGALDRIMTLKCSPRCTWLSLGSDEPTFEVLGD